MHKEVNHMVTVIRISGKAKDVFARIKLMADKAGKLTLGEIARLSGLKR